MRGWLAMRFTAYDRTAGWESRRSTMDSSPSIPSTTARTFARMLERVVSDTGVVFYRSPLLAAAGVPHAFSTRLGGISAAPFDSLNLGNPNGCAVQDDVAQIAENYRLLQGAC